MLLIVALVAVAFALFAWAAAAYKNAVNPSRSPRIGNANRQFSRRHFRKFHLAPLLIERIAWWFGFSRAPRGGIQFANIGEGTQEHGVKTFLADAATTGRYLLYKAGSDADHCAIAGLNDVCLGPSDDQAEAGLPIAINLLGVKPGLIRVQTDGTIANGNPVKSGAAGQATKATTGDAGIFGIALIGTDASSAAGDTIVVQHSVPMKYSF